MMLVLAAAAVVTVQSGTPPHSQVADASSAGFDLAPRSGRTISREDAAPSEPDIPANLEIRDFTVDPPELVLPISDKGPRLLVGALGGRGHGMPKLAHVGIGWAF